MYEGYTTWTNEAEDHWLATKEWPWSQEKEEGRVNKLAQIAREKLKRELKWKKSMNGPKRRDEEDKDYESRWSDNTEAWKGKDIWNKWRRAAMRKEEELEDERIVFESEEMICIKNKETGEFRWEENSIEEERPVKRRKMENFQPYYVILFGAQCPSHQIHYLLDWGHPCCVFNSFMGSLYAA
uniref:Coiled-coil domain-containing protein 102A n=1 Tax=Parastrongyloides trichosuri TaxID=131310 RepID=A0A0N4ZD97_PARTI